MNLNQLAVQLGVAGFLILIVLLVVYRIAILLIRNWRAIEKERTTALTDGLTSIVDRLQFVGDKVVHLDGKLEQLTHPRPRIITSAVGQPHLRTVDDDNT